MWLFRGRYAQYGPVICGIALCFASIAAIFTLVAARITYRREGSSGRGGTTGKIIAGLLIAAAAMMFGEIIGFGEPVFVPGYGLNAGDALILAVAATLLGIAALVSPKRLRRWRVLLLVLASGMIFGDITGWIRRSAQPSKYDVGG
jgi:hypothetical protein